jgi:uncharacterized protein
MISYLADVNFWIALSYSAHVHHPLAAEWFENSPDNSVAFCRITQAGFLRLLTNRNVMREDVAPAVRAWQLYDRLRQSPRIAFAQEPPGLEESWRHLTRHPRTGPNFWTDAYLAAFARAAGLQILTFDRALARQVGSGALILGSGLVQ